MELRCLQDNTVVITEPLCPLTLFLLKKYSTFFGYVSFPAATGIELTVCCLKLRLVFKASVPITELSNTFFPPTTTTTTIITLRFDD